MCNYSKREAAMVTVRPGVHCDPCLVPLVRALYENGFPTVASCCGHGEQPANVALSDGRQVFVADPEQADRIWAALRKEEAPMQAQRTNLTAGQRSVLRAIDQGWSHGSAPGARGRIVASLYDRGLVTTTAQRISAKSRFADLSGWTVTGPGREALEAEPHA